MLAKQIWNIAVKKDNLWIKWVHVEKLREKSIWEIIEDPGDSWGWKNLLRIRDKVRENVKCKVNNGRNTSMWYDNWCSMGPLIQYLTHRDIYDARLSMNLSVGDMIDDGKWKWPLELFDKFPLITSLKDPNFNTEANDTVVWLSKSGEEGNFSVKNTTIDLCTSVPKVYWWRLVWYSQCIPKHSFILWLAIQNRLSTQEKLQKWGIHNVNRCPLCLIDNEDLQHLFFDCAFSTDVWNRAKEIADIKCDKTNWDELIKSVADECIHKNIGWVVRRLVLAASVYFLWQERNGRIFKDVQNSSQEVYKKVFETVKCKLLGIMVKDSHNVRSVEGKWQVKCRRANGI